MGHKLTDQGICPDPGKVSAVHEMPRPLDKVGVQRFLGMCNYLSKFSPNLSATVLPLRNLVKQNVEFNWSDSQENAFNAAKDLIAPSTNLRYYDVKLPVTLQVDASDEAIGGVLMQEGKPVCFTSHTLTDTEKQYAQIEKECLAIMTSMKKWHQYLFGKHDIIVQTDHQPLEIIFKKPLGKAPRRLQRMMLQLQQYNFEVVYKRGKELYVADTLSRAALKENCAVELESEMVFRVELEQMGLKPAMMSDCTLNRMKEETRKDQTLKCLLETTVLVFREEITLYEGVLLKTHQVIVPTVLRKEMLEKIHKSHQGADSSIRRAREALFWPGMSANIRQMSEACGICAQFQTEQPREPMKSHEIPKLPWSRISVDLFQLAGKNYLVMVDHYSDFIELDHLKNTTANSVIKVMKKNFARHGIPSECVSDNGPQFDSSEYRSFAREHGFTPVKSSPYYSQGNGKAELIGCEGCKEHIKKIGQRRSLLGIISLSQYSATRIRIFSS
ncbi:Transposon Ty3-G Gag-Pol poly [Paramuricea clavata]|uniref:Transposon Ty3-G Gag-Pol poly n=1 Tax=Paramuricea clavata TaxID=317549 RepID=A0A6S7J2U2_PARCT|nr:Transposon Ty3-G Gag-Pol poly [Paramuricea clavata]